MLINITYDSSVAGAPAGYKVAVDAAVQYFENTFDAPITVNITFGWGEVGGQPMDPNALGESLTTFVRTNYVIGVRLLLDHDTSPATVNAVLSLPAAGQTNAPIFELPFAEARVLGQASESPDIPDGYIGLASSAPFTFDPNNQAVAGEYGAVGALEHEISEVLGRQAFDGRQLLNGGASNFTLLDFFRLSAPSVHTYKVGASNFSLNGDQLLLPFNDPSNGGDAGDWSQGVTGDAFDAFGDVGIQEQVSAVDLRVLELLGYHLSPTAPTPNGVPTTPLIFNQNLQLASGQTLNFDGPLALVMKELNSVAPSLTNSATIIDTGLRSQTDVIGVTIAFYAGGQIGQNETRFFSGSVFNNSASGTVNVTATADAADAVGVYYGPNVTNAGLIQVTSNKADAWGVIGDPFTNTSTGTLRVHAADYATGINLLAQGGAFSNSGVIEVTGVHAIGVEGMTSFDNSGTLKAIGIGPGATSDAVYIAAPYGVTYTNSGLIQGEYAFVVDPTYRGGFPDISITNSGTINGKISLVNSNSQIHNTGSMVGAIQFGDGNNIYDGASGTQSGGIYLGHGTNTVTLGNDGEAAFGGGGSDTITGGSGNDFIEIGRGTNSIDGGGGFNTLSLADSDIGVTVNLGSGTVSGAGTSTIANIQQVIGSSFNDTLIAGASAATLIAGSGHSILTGGAGNDTLVAGAGGDTVTGNGGNDTFVYSSGDHQLVITDFGANGDQDVLKIYGYASASSVQQQGADALITLSGSDTVLLKNVQTSSLTGSNVLYSANPYQGPNLPASLPIFGTSTIYFTYDLKIIAGETINSLNQHVGLVNVGAENPNWDGSYHTLDNFGVINVSASSGDVAGLTAEFDSNPSTPGRGITNEAGATFSVTNTDLVGVARGLDFSNELAPSIVNAGSFNVIASGDAYWIDTSYANNVKNTVTGAITVLSSGNDAYGIYVHNDASTNTGGIVNAGSLHVSGTHSVYGIRSDRFEFSSIVNNGDLTVLGQGGSANTYGIYVEAVGVSIASVITNTGIITAQTAIESPSVPDFSPSLVITNSGTIHGAVQLAIGEFQIHNTGSMVGAIQFGDGNNIYDGASGTQSGGIYLGHGTNTVTLGNDGEAAFGGGGSDTITGGSGNDFIEIGRGTNSIDGGGGFNTLSLADSDIGVTVNLGSGTVSGAGTSTIANIQQVIGSSFNDTLIAGASAATLIAGSGHSILTGGAGNDTLVAGAGGDTVTGNGGNDTFVYSSGDHQLVITDFGANGDQDVLKIYGYASASSVQQQGADALITLSGSDTVLLKNVQTSSLTGSNVLYSANPYQGPNLPASPATYFGSTAPVIFQYDLTVYAGEIIHITAHTSDLEPNQNLGFVDRPSYLSSPDGGIGRSFDNSGTVNIDSPDAELWGLFLVNGDRAVITNRAGATYTVSDAADAAAGMTIDTEGVSVTNAGTIIVDALTWSTGISDFGRGFTFTNAASGTLNVTSHTGDASGLSLLGTFATAENDGTIAVRAAGIAYGILSLAGESSIINTGAFYESSIVNTGAISVLSSDPSAATYGIAVSASYNVDSNGSISNTGTITAQTAILNADSGDGFTPLIVSNSGTINGDVDLGGSDSKLTNTGTITGNIFFSTVTKEIGSAALFGIGPPSITNSGKITGNISLGGSNAVISSTGTISGNILLSDGNDTVDLRGGTLTGAIVIGPTIPGKSTEDVIYTGAAGGLINIHSGDANLTATITSGVGGRTTVQYDEASTQAALSQNVDGSWTVSAGSDGVETLVGVEKLQFTDRTVAIGTAPQSDFNGDGKSDILFQNTDGTPAIWTINGTAVASASTLPNPGAAWRIAGTGDFNGDGKADILWRNTDGSIAIWYLNGGSVTGGTGVVTGLSNDWQIKGTGDFNGDGIADILFQNTDGTAAIWTMNANGTLKGAASYASPGAGWSVVAAGDFNADGKSDILWRNSDGSLMILFMNGLTELSSTSVGNPGAAWKVAGLGDFNGDGSADILFQNDSGLVAIWEIQNGAVIAEANLTNPGAGWVVKGAADLNGDGMSDIILRSANGALSGWLMNGLTVSSTVSLGNSGSTSQLANWGYTAPPPLPHIAASDFDGDGNSDILFQNTDGTPAIWTMNGAAITGASSLANPGTSWTVVGAGDFDGDGKADILWRNADGSIAIWFMNGTQILSGSGVATGFSNAWHIRGTGDFNGDGNSDILFQNTDGTPAIWTMNGAAITGASSLPNPGSSWTVVGAGDFDGDGKSDILWRNSDGSIAIWFMNGTQILSGSGVATGFSNAWQIKGIGDFNGDGKSDILFQNTDGTPAIWTMNGAAITGASSLSNPGTAWTVVGARDLNGDGKSDILWRNTDGSIAVWFMNGLNVASGSGIATGFSNAWQIAGTQASPPVFGAQLATT